MITKIFNGNFLYKFHISKLSSKIEQSIYFYSCNPFLAVIVIDNNFSSNLYVKNKIFSCKSININYIVFKSTKTLRLSTLLILIKILNVDFLVNAILIQKPIPDKLNLNCVFCSIDFSKDVDFINPLHFFYYFSRFGIDKKSCVSQAVFTFLNKIKCDLIGKKVIIYGFSNLIGKPLLFNFMSRGSSVTIVNRYRNNLDLLKVGDIFIIAVGSSLFLSKSMIPYGSIVIDIGINKYINDKVIGDVCFNDLLGKVSWITPVPGGIGPLTILYLLSNTFKLYLYQNKRKIK